VCPGGIAGRSPGEKRTNKRYKGEVVKARTAIFKTDWFLAVVVVIAIIVLGNTSGLIPSLERKVYDLGVEMSTRTPSDRIAVIAIDDASIANIGRWPWPRDVHARFTDQIAAAKPRVIANTVFFFEPQRDPGLDYINQLLELYVRQFPEAANPAATGGVASTPPASTLVPARPATSGGIPAEWGEFGALLRKAESSLNTDRQLAESFTRAGNVLLPMFLTLGAPQGRPDAPLAEFVARQILPGAGGGLVPAAAVTAPIEVLGKAAGGVGALNSLPDADGGLRREPLIYGYFTDGLPSLALMTAARSLNLGVPDMRFVPGELTLGGLRIRTDNDGSMLTYFYKDQGDRPAFQRDSFHDVLTGKIPASKYAGKIVLIGATAAGVGTSFPTPVSPAMSPVEALAHSVSSILSEHFFVVPAWALAVEWLVLLLVAAYLIVLLPRLRAGMGAGLTAGLLLVLIMSHFALMTGPGWWLQLMLPATVLLLGHLALTTKRFLKTEAGKDRSDLESAESNRMLGLAFQGQGQLDMAFDKFRKVPLNDALMDNLYNLALDFERKRQFNKAQSVYEYMATHDPDYRDLSNKIARARSMSETVILGGPGSTRSNASLVSAGGDSVEKPMLGRYQVEKELGKGAMGVVYLGRDPKIGRVVAIKTMALSQEFEGEELVEVKERFFREAETAGRLNHPGIVTIFDAGEEHDLAFIAMEFLKGRDLVPYTRLDTLLPIPQVVSIHARVAEALSYAHRQNIVHRDIKPGNIMYEPESDTVKVTDFGIARITDSSRTKTGMVLGTPSYMSPEQLSGLKIDGRSDLFSLAVSCYQMCCGRLPFTGDSMAQLMFRIANEEAPDIRSLNPAVSPALAEVLRRAMMKDAAQRYQTGDELAAALRAALTDGDLSASTVPVPSTVAASTASASPTVAASVVDSTNPSAHEATTVLEAPVDQPPAASTADAAPNADDAYIRTQPVAPTPPSSGPAN